MIFIIFRLPKTKKPPKEKGLGKIITADTVAYAFHLSSVCWPA